MQLNHAAQMLESAVHTQLRMADPGLTDLGKDLLEVLRPAIRQTLMQVTEMAAHEVNGQLAGQRVEIRLVDGEPELKVVTDDSELPRYADDESTEAEARITLRLPGQLKELIAEAAETAGDSVNAFVVDALRTKARERPARTSVRRTLDL